MSKETKEMLKTILSNQDLIMKHLGIKVGDKSKKEIKAPAKKAEGKDATVKQSKTKKAKS